MQNIREVVRQAESQFNALQRDFLITNQIEFHNRILIAAICEECNEGIPFASRCSHAIHHVMLQPFAMRMRQQCFICLPRSRITDYEVANFNAIQRDAYENREAMRLSNQQAVINTIHHSIDYHQRLIFECTMCSRRFSNIRILEDHFHACWNRPIIQNN